MMPDPWEMTCEAKPVPDTTQSLFFAVDTPEVIAAKATVIRFGKHKGRTLADVPLDYLVWCLANLERLDCRAGIETIVRAAGCPVPPPPPPGSSPRTHSPSVLNRSNGRVEAPERAMPGLGSARMIAAAEVRAIVKTWYGELARRYHPDRGGTAEQFALVSTAYQSLMIKLEQWEARK